MIPQEVYQYNVAPYLTLEDLYAWNDPCFQQELNMRTGEEIIPLVARYPEVTTILTKKLDERSVLMYLHGGFGNCPGYVDLVLYTFEHDFRRIMSRCHHKMFCHLLLSSEELLRGYIAHLTDGTPPLRSVPDMIRWMVSSTDDSSKYQNVNKFIRNIRDLGYEMKREDLRAVLVQIVADATGVSFSQVCVLQELLEPNYRHFILESNDDYSNIENYVETCIKTLGRPVIRLEDQTNLAVKTLLHQESRKLLVDLINVSYC